MKGGTSMHPNLKFLLMTILALGLIAVLYMECQHGGLFDPNHTLVGSKVRPAPDSAPPAGVASSTSSSNQASAPEPGQSVALTPLASPSNNLADKRAVGVQPSATPAAALAKAARSPRRDELEMERMSESVATNSSATPKSPRMSPKSKS